MSKKVLVVAGALAVAGTTGWFGWQHVRASEIEKNAGLIIEQAKANGIEVSTWSYDRGADAILLQDVTLIDQETKTPIKARTARVELMGTTSISTLPRLIANDGSATVDVNGMPVTVRFTEMTADEVSVEAAKAGQPKLTRAMLKGVSIIDARTALTIDDVVVNDVDGDVFSKVAMSGVKLLAPVTPGNTAKTEIVASHLELEVDPASLRKAASQGAEKWEKYESGTLRGFSAQDVTVRSAAAPAADMKLGLLSYRAKSDSQGFLNDIDFRVERLSGDVSKIPDMGTRQMLAMAGYEKVDVSFSLMARSDKDKQAIDLGPVKFSSKDDFEIVAGASLNGVVIPTSIGQAPDYTAAKLSQLKVTLTDHSALGRAITKVSAMTGLSATDLRTAMKQNLVAIGSMYDLSTESVLAITKFIETDGGELTLTVVPAEGVTLVDAVAASSGLDMLQYFKPVFAYKQKTS